MTEAQITKKIQNARDARNYAPVSFGDAVRYDRFGWTGVVISVKRTQVVVQTTPGQTMTWYRSGITVI